MIRPQIQEALQNLNCSAKRDETMRQLGFLLPTHATASSVRGSVFVGRLVCQRLCSYASCGLSVCLSDHPSICFKAINFFITIT